MWHLKRRQDVLHGLIPSETPEEVVTESPLVITLILLETPEVLLAGSLTVRELIPSETPEVLSVVNPLVIALIPSETPEGLLVESLTVQELILSETPEVQSVVIHFPVAQTHLALSAASFW